MQDLKQKTAPQYGIVLVTASSQDEAEAIAQALLQFDRFTPGRAKFTMKLNGS
jgi:hypothetical protein